MKFLARAGSHMFTTLQKIFPAGQDLLAILNIYEYHRPIQCIVHNARSHVPIFSRLQIPINDIARSFGNEFLND
jgi:hypothetical protein